MVGFFSHGRPSFLPFTFFSAGHFQSMVYLAVYENKQDRTTHKILEKSGVLCKLTKGYWRDLEKPVDLCTLLYHQGAHIPSNSLGPASHLKRGNSVNWINTLEHFKTLYMMGLHIWSQKKLKTSGVPVSCSFSIKMHTSTFVAGKECPDPHKVPSRQPACEGQANWIHWTVNVKLWKM
jgi:hypothetical protein